MGSCLKPTAPNTQGARRMTNSLIDPQPSRKRMRVQAETCRMFESDLLERFSRIHPATPFVIWVPVAFFFVARSVSRHDLALPAVAGLFLCGMFAWTCAEYVLHRYVFHWTNNTGWGKRIHFLLHGVHHDFPNDKDRLVMPLPMSIPLAFIFYPLFTLTMRPTLGESFFAGFVVGYLFYD